MHIGTLECRLVGFVFAVQVVVALVGVDFGGGAGVSQSTALRPRNGPAMLGRASLPPLLQLLLCGVFLFQC